MNIILAKFPSTRDVSNAVSETSVKSGFLQSDSCKLPRGEIRPAITVGSLTDFRLHICI